MQTTELFYKYQDDTKNLQNLIKKIEVEMNNYKVLTSAHIVNIKSILIYFLKD